MPVGKTCWMLWFSSMITRILRSWPDPAARPAAGCDPAVLVVALVAEPAPVPGAEDAAGAEEQPTTRKLPIRPAPARPAPTRKGRCRDVRPRGLDVAENRTA